MRLASLGAASVSTRNVEQEIIDQTLDKELQKYLGLTGEEDDDDENNFYDSYAEDENDGSIKSLGVKKRTKHLRTLVAKIHNFQMNENEQAGVGDGVGDGVGEGECGSYSHLGEGTPRTPNMYK